MADMMIQNTEDRDACRTPPRPCTESPRPRPLPTSCAGPGFVDTPTCDGYRVVWNVTPYTGRCSYESRIRGLSSVDLDALWDETAETASFYATTRSRLHVELFTDASMSVIFWHEAKRHHYGRGYVAQAIWEALEAIRAYRGVL